MKIAANIKLFIYSTLVLGFLYPLLVYWVSEMSFKTETHGSKLIDNQNVVGSELIGQNFVSKKYFQGRPSASHYDSLQSGGTNLSSISSRLKHNIQERRDQGFEDEMLFSSASGLDPHISKKSALAQLNRIQVERNFSTDLKNEIVSLIETESNHEASKMLGKAQINVLRLNIAMDKLIKGYYGH